MGVVREEKVKSRDQFECKLKLGFGPELFSYAMEPKSNPHWCLSSSL